MAWIIVFFTSLLNSAIIHVLKRHFNVRAWRQDDDDDDSNDASNEAAHPPSPRYAQDELVLNLVDRLEKFEHEVYNQQMKPIVMPRDKEELLDAMFRRIEALEAELISTKNALYDAVARQDELLACIDRQENAPQVRAKKSCGKFGI